MFEFTNINHKVPTVYIGITTQLNLLIILHTKFGLNEFVTSNKAKNVKSPKATYYSRPI